MFAFDPNLRQLGVEIPLLLTQISVMAFLEGWTAEFPSKYSF